jgi:asparagine synthase (glutamine-hydrolysing)
MLFEEYYPGYANVVPYFWMPKYVNATDPSARTLGIYKDAMT